MSYRKMFLILTVISVCCFSIRANAQIPHFGVKAGLNLANIYGADVSKTFSTTALKPGVVVGAYMTYDLVPFLSIQPEVLYSMKGTKATENPPLPRVPVDITQIYNYIEVPVLLKLNLPLGPALPFTPSIYAGPDFAFNVVSKNEGTGPGIVASVDTKYLTRSFDFNVAVGLGAGFGVGPANLGLELRYTFGTGSLLKAGEGTVKNGVFAVIASVGI